MKNNTQSARSERETPAQGTRRPLPKPDTIRILREFVWPEAKKRFHLLVIVTVFAALSSAIPGGQLLLVKMGLDKAAGPGAGAALLRFGLAIVGLELLRAACGFVSGYTAMLVGTSVTEQTRNRLFEKLLRLPLSYHLWKPRGELLSRAIHEADGVQRCLSLFTHDLVKQAVMFVVLLAVIFWLDFQLALIAVVVYPVGGILFAVLGRKLRDITHRTYEVTAGLGGFLHECLRGIKIVKASCSERRMQEIYEKETARISSTMKRVFLASFFLPQIGSLLGLAGIITAAAVGVVRLSSGSITRGTLAAFLAAMFLFYRPLKAFAGFSRNLSKGIAPIERCAQILAEPVAIVEKPDARDLPPLSREIRFEHVFHSYDGSEDVLKDINIEIPAGRTAALVGRSGSGKTTLVNLIPRFYDPTAGRITIDGTDIRDVTLRSLRSQIAIVTQETILFSSSIRENITFGADEPDEARMREAARLAHVEEFVSRMPEGYDSPIGEGGMRLSGGEAQRIAIARALYWQPRILILDEATSHVDSESEVLLRSAIENLMSNRTTIVIAHRLSTVRRADVIFVLDDGRIAERGTHAELLEADGLYAGLCRLQFFTADDENP